MSIRASLLNLMLKLTVRKQFSNLDDIEALRKGGGLRPGAPEDLKIEPVDANGVPAEWVSWPGASDDTVLLYLHGGGYVFGGPDSHRDLAGRLARACGMKALVLDYRLAPEHPFPAAVEDATAAWRWLLDQGYAPHRMAVAGDSAGGGLSVSLMTDLKNQGLALPHAAVLISPWVDLALTGESAQRNADVDPMLSPAALTGFAGLYLGDRDAKAPLASPLYADLSNLPPIKIVVGDTEMLLSDSERLAEKITAAGGNVSLGIWPGMPHVFPLFAGLIPEGRQAVAEIGQFLVEQMGTRPIP